MVKFPCRELDDAIALIDGSPFCGAEDTSAPEDTLVAEDTSAPATSISLQVQVWPQPVFRMHHGRCKEGAPVPSGACGYESDASSKVDASTAAITFSPDTWRAPSGLHARDCHDFQ